MASNSAGVTFTDADFHQLCALLVAVKPDRPPSRKSDINLHTSFLPKDLNHTVATYLDSLAKILVSRRVSQVFAVAAEVKSSSGLLKLTVAENNGRYDKAAEHLQNVWRVLAEISNELYPGSQQVDRDHLAKRSPRRMISRYHCAKLAGIIYKRSWNKLAHRLKKAAAVALKFLQYAHNAGRPQELDDLAKIALTALRLRDMVDNGNGKIDENIVKKFKNFAVACNSYFADPSTLDTTPGLSSFNRLRASHPELLKTFTDEQLDHLEKKIRKSVDITNAIRTLAELGSSTRMHHLFCGKEELDVETLQCEKGEYVLPKGDGWRKAFEKSLDEALVNDKDLILERVLNEQIDKAKVAHDSFLNPRACTTHCEVTIVAHFVNSSLSPIPYIGVSKLSCQLCSEFLAALADTSPSKTFYTRGCSGHWFFPWKLPAIFVGSGSGVDRKMYLALIRLFNKHINYQAEFKRTGSTSSCGSSGFNVDDDYSDEEDEGYVWDHTGQYL